MDKFEDLQAFVAVVEAGSFTAAADRLNAAKSAVSRRVSALEERLGVQLLRRTTRVLNLTETGSSFYEHSARILADLDEAEAAVQQEHGELKGMLRVALPLSFGVRHMCKPIAAFSKLHPKVNFDLNLNDRRIDLIEEGADVALRIGRLQDSSLIARRLFDVRAVVCASPHYLSVHGKPETPADLQHHDCLVYSNLADPNKWSYVDEDGGNHSVEVRPVLSASSGDFLANAAADELRLADNVSLRDLPANKASLVPGTGVYRFSGGAIFRNPSMGSRLRGTERQADLTGVIQRQPPDIGREVGLHEAQSGNGQIG
jgi:DNA-binding transcriptional LysR family regulator